MRMRGLLFNLLLATVINQDFKQSETPKNTQTENSVLDSYYNPVYSIENETLGQINNSWIKTYTLKYNGEKTIIPFSEIVFEYFAENLSNSKLKPHTFPKKSNPSYYNKNKEIVYEPVRHTLNRGREIFVPITNGSDRDKCREKIEVKIRKFDTEISTNTTLNQKFLHQKFLTKQKISDEQLDYFIDSNIHRNFLELNSGDRLETVIKIEHDHFLYGKYDPLFGDRIIDLTIGPGKIHDEFSINKEVNPAIVIPKLNTIPPERIDEYNENIDRIDKRKNLVGRTGKFLYLAADIPGYQYYRFDDMYIRAGDRFKLSFDYLIAKGTEGSCHIRIMEYQNTPNAWYRLEGGFDVELGLGKSIYLENVAAKADKRKLYQALFEDKSRQILLSQNTPKKQGRWEQFEYTIKTRDDSTTIAPDFRIIEANFGEMWIDINSLKFENLDKWNMKN